MIAGARLLLLAGVTALAGTPAMSAPAGHRALPRTPGSCVWTAVKDVGQRLEDGDTHQPMPHSGSAIGFANGLYLVSYDQIAAVNESRRGDRALLCLVRLPRNCPPGDDRGKLYTATNLRTRQSWTMIDSEHICGGA